MSYNYQYQQPEQSYQYGSVYGSNASAATGGSNQFGAQQGYNSVPYGSPGYASGGVVGGTSGQPGMQNPQYATGYGGQQTNDPNYAAYYSGSTPATTGANAYPGLAATQATMAQAPASMASGYSNGQSLYYSSGVPASSPPSYGSAQPSPALYSSQSTAADYPYGTGYPGSVRSSSGGMEGYAAYPTSDSAADLHQSAYASTYPSSHDGVSSATAALGAVAGMPIPLGSSGGFAAGVNGATGTAAEGEQGSCLIM